jgi:hypothetical protein
MIAKAGAPTFAAIRLDGESTRPPPAGFGLQAFENYTNPQETQM